MVWFEGHIDSIAGSSNFSIQIDDHVGKTTRILDDPAPTRETGMDHIKTEVDKLAKKYGLFKTMPVSMSVGYR